MNANGQRFWLLRAEADWTWDPDEQPIDYDAVRGSLQLRSLRPAPEPIEGAPDRGPRIAMTPGTVDALGTRAWWDEGEGRILAAGAGSGTVAIDTYPGAEGVETSIFEAGDPAPSDLLLGEDGVMYVAVSGRIVLVDRRGRFKPESVTFEGFAPWRLATAEGGGVWAVEQGSGRIARLMGSPLPRLARMPSAKATFRPEPENPDPPRLRMVHAAIGAGEEPVALAGSPDGKLAVFTRDGDGRGLLRVLEDDGEEERWSAPTELLGGGDAYSVGWIGEDHVAILLPGHGEAWVYPASEGGETTLPSGEHYPLPRHVPDTPLWHGTTPLPHYGTLEGTEPLRALSLRSLATAAEASNAPLRPLDSRRRDTVWDRIYLEAELPPRCGVTLSLAATDGPAPPDADEDGVWFDHLFGAAPPGGSHAESPRGTWMREPSELPHHPGLLPCHRERDRAGCFTASVQRAGRAVRALRGRYLWVRARLRGDQRTTPEIFALRVYASRFSYRDEYLAELYHEDRFGPDADLEGAATGADFLDRFLGLFEGVLTPLEDSIAASYLVTEPKSAPPAALDWLASWMGLELPTGAPEAARRELVERASELARWRGTLRGLQLALDLATDGAVRGGEIVIVEDFRLRRTFATVLGVELGDDYDPLLAGPTFHGNSMLGDTMFFGDETNRELLAVFRADRLLSKPDAKAVREFFDASAHRLTVLVHERVEEQELGLIEAIAEDEGPAHLEIHVIRASHPLVVGMASLVGVDTYLSRRRPPRPLRVEVSTVGAGDVLRSPGSLDPRLEGGEA